MSSLVGIYLLFGSLLWVIFALVTAEITSERKSKISWGGIVLISIFLSPIVAYVVLLLSKDQQTDEFEKVMIEHYKKEEE